MKKKLWLIIFALLSLCMTSCNYSTKNGEWFSEEEATYEVIEEEKKEPAKEVIYVYICGEVNNPGVYEIEDNKRIYELIELAGGLTENADINDINQALKLNDGEKIYVKSYEEVKIEQITNGQKSDGKVNINTASVSELVKIRGIGQSRAEAIVEYRNQHGKFSNKEDIMQISGIKNGLYDKIKDQIKVD